MKRRHTDPIPRRFAGHPAADGLLVEHDIAVRGATGRPGRLRVKLLVFRSKVHMQRFCRGALDYLVGRAALGFVHDLGQTVERTVDGRRVRERAVDPRYTSVIGLVHGHLSMEIITHESVHAAFFYSRRSTQRWPYQEHCADEAVCYPAGRIARQINVILHDNGLYGDRLPERFR